MNNRYLLVLDNIVKNIIVWDGFTPYTPPEGYLLLESIGTEDFGWILQEDGTFAPPPPTDQPAPQDPQ